MLNMDFTFAKYKELCETMVESKYTTLTFSQYFTLKNIPEKFIILRHDVDRNPESALKMAKLENDSGIVSTYYFMMKRNDFTLGIIKEIANMGHEIGITTKYRTKRKAIVDTSALFAIANAKDFSYVDATSFAVMERLGITDAFSFDEHFEQYSLNRLPDE